METPHLPARYKPGCITKLDGRRKVARRMKAIANDLGGLRELSCIKTSLLERFVRLEAALQRMEDDLSQCTDTSVSNELLARWVQACNSLLGIGKVLGLNRKAKVVDLSTYIESTYGGAEDLQDK